MKKNSIIVLLLFIANLVLAQKNTIGKLNFYATIGGVFNGSINSSSSSEMVDSKYTFAQYQDSISSKETWRFNFSPQLGIIYLISKKADLQVGLSYLVLGHQRQLKNLQYNSNTYPGVGSPNGQIVENTNVERNIDLNYRYHYLQMPILYNYHLKSKFYSQKINMAISAGVGLNLLLLHDINAVLSTGFKLDGKSSFSIDSTGYSGRFFNANVLLGVRADYNFSKQLKFVFQPMFGYFPVSVSNKQLEAKPWYLNLNLGIIYTLDELKK